MTDFNQMRDDFVDMYERAYKGDFDPVYQFCSPAFTCTNPLSPLISVDEIVASIRLQIAAFEGIKFKCSYAFASDTGMAIAYTISGRHVGEVFGLKPSGRFVEVPGLSLHELYEGKSIGGWSCAWFKERLEAAYAEALQAGELPQPA